MLNYTLFDDYQALCRQCRAAGVGEGVISGIILELGIEGAAEKRGYLTIREWRQVEKELLAEIDRRKAKKE